MEKENVERKLLLAVGFEEAENGTANYIVQIPEGSSVTETAFCVNVVIRCLIKDNVIEKPSDFLDYVTKYLNEPQYGETK